MHFVLNVKILNKHFAMEDLFPTTLGLPHSVLSWIFWIWIWIPVVVRYVTASSNNNLIPPRGIRPYTPWTRSNAWIKQSNQSIYVKCYQRCSRGYRHLQRLIWSHDDCSVSIPWLFRVSLMTVSIYYLLSNKCDNWSNEMQQHFRVFFVVVNIKHTLLWHFHG